MIVGKIKYPAVYICIAMALWGLVSGLMAVVHNFSGLVACRFFLGIVEAVFFPGMPTASYLRDPQMLTMLISGALYYLSMFYNRKQFAFRTAILYSGSQLGNAFGGLFAIAILNLDGHDGIEGWRWVSL